MHEQILFTHIEPKLLGQRHDSMKADNPCELVLKLWIVL